MPSPIKKWPVLDIRKCEHKSHIYVSIVLTVFIHSLWVISASFFLQNNALENISNTHPEMLLFVETNPHAPSHEPDHTLHHAARNQTAAQESAAPTIPLSVNPYIEGEVIHSQSIVTYPYPQKVEENHYHASSYQTSTPASANHSPPSSNLSNPQSPDSTHPNSFSSESTTHRPKPLPRPIHPSKLLQAPIIKTTTRVESTGIIAIDAKLSPFGTYQQQLLEAISLQWHLLATHLKSADSSKHTHVLIQMELGQDGRIIDAHILENTGNSSSGLICLDAIHSVSPFGQWPESMIKLLGSKQTLRIYFYYR